MRIQSILVIVFCLSACTAFSGKALAQFTWDGDCSTLWYDCCMQGKNFVNNWAVQGNPSTCPPVPGPNDSASISGVVDSQGYQIGVKSLSQGGTFFCRAQTLTINDGVLSTFGSILEPSTLQMLDGSIINIMPPSDVVNGSSCTFDVRSGYVRSIDPWKGTQLFTNQGTITKTAQPEVNSWISVKLENQGLITCESGTLLLSGGGTSNGTIAPVHDTTIRLEGPWTDIGGEVAGQGTIWFSAGNYTVTGDYHPKYTIISYGNGGTTALFNSNNSVENLMLGNSGALGGTGDLTIDNLTWNEGAMLAGGKTVVNDTAFFPSCCAKDLYRDMELHGITTCQAGVLWRLNEAEIRNYGELNLLDDGSIVQFCCTLNSGLKNYGTIKKSGSSGATISVLVSNVGGTIDVEAGTLRFDAQMATTGPITVNAGAEVVLGHGDGQSIFPQGSISGGGTVRFSGGVLDQIEGNIDVPNIIIDYGQAKFQIPTTTANLTMIDGKLLGIGDFTVANHLEWHNGEMRDEGVTRVQGTVHLTGFAALNRTMELANAKATVEPGPGTLHIGPEGSLLRGSGTIGGNISNLGTVSPGMPDAPIGTIDVAGNYGASCCFSSTELRVDLDGAANDRVNVTGTANLLGRLVVSGSPTPGQSYTIMTAGNVAGSFGQVVAPPGTEVEYTPTSVIVRAPWGPTALVNFDTYPDGSVVQPGEVFTDQWASVGVVLSNGAGGGPGPSGNPCSISAPNHAYAATGLIVARFVDPCTGALSVTDEARVFQDHCWAPGEGLDVYAYDARGNEIGHQFVQGGGTAANFEFETQIIARLDIFHIGQGIDDLSFVRPAAVPDDCPADITDNGTVNVNDLLAVINAWGPCGLGICESDVNCDRIVNVNDLLAVINAWGPCR